MRVVAVHPDLIVFISRVWQTSCTALRAREEGFVIDSPVYPDELDALPGVLEQAGFPVSGLLATHADWDHLLGRLAFPDASVGCGETTARRLMAEPGAAQRSLRQFDQEHYVDGRQPLSLGGVQELPVPGRLELGAERELELHPADGHTADGTAYWIPWLQVLVCGDYLSPVEIPMIAEGGSVEAYAATLRRLRPLVGEATTVIPGHGAPLAGEEAMRVLDEDAAYVDALAGVGADAGITLPKGRRTPAQRQVHARNLAHLAARGGD
jgi:glyoxylase-like metal-dependent hydrolase (beta-lactamase superfamily II)